MNRLLLIAGGSTLVYLVLAVLMGVFPGIELSRIPAGPGVQPLTAFQSEGRRVFVANGCSYCHTQQVRPLNQDKVFGRPSAPGDFAFQTPELLGSQRTGPDLTNVGERQPSEVWQYIHLYNPRAVVPQSIMPAFEWLFEVVDHAPPGVTPIVLPKRYAPAHGVVVPTHDARALVAYLMALKQSPLPESANPSRTAREDPARITAQVSSGVQGAGDHDEAKGQALFTATCAPCHQTNGEGLAGVFPPLKGNAAVNDADPTQHIRVILHGLQGANIGGIVYPSPMPPFAMMLNDADIVQIINYERHAWGNQGAAVTIEQVAAERARSP